VIADGKEIARETHFGFAGLPNSNNLYRLTILPLPKPTTIASSAPPSALPAGRTRAVW